MLLCKNTSITLFIQDFKHSIHRQNGRFRIGLVNIFTQLNNYKKNLQNKKEEITKYTYIARYIFE